MHTERGVRRLGLQKASLLLSCHSYHGDQASFT
uniref:Uncharacterized protein n=1 Tax=Anguilla anguilla TaxID=7936 RepID=A0A0E9TUA2_ANGAN